MKTAALLLAALALPAGAPARAGDDPPPRIERFLLENGLRVALRPVEGASHAAVTVLFDFGEDADPEGRSGLAHLCEHLYCTAAAGATPARTAEDLARTHPDGWNAQTGRDSTVFSGVVPPARLEEEIGEAVRRLTALKVTEDDLRRERPRVLAELENMYARSPALAAVNLARERVTDRGAGRHGGLAEELFDVSLEEAAAFLRARYRPAAARLIVAGAVEAGAWAPRIRALFPAAPARGADAPPPAPLRSAGAVPEDRPPLSVVRTGEDGFRQGPCAAAAWRAPRPGTADYAAFLVLAVRLWTRSARSETDPRERPIAVFAPLDDPDFLCVRAGVGATEPPEAAAKRLEEFARKIVDAPLREGEAQGSKVHLAKFLGTMDLPDGMFASNPYLVSFGLGRREQLGIDGPALAKALDAVTEESLVSVRKKWFGAPAVVVAMPDRR